jgi:spermidine/putrescine-binding protein
VRRDDDDASGSSSAEEQIGGTLTYVGWDGEDGKTIAGSFLKKNNVKLDSSYVASGDEVLTKLRQGGQGTVDLVAQNKDYLKVAIELGLLTPLDLERLPAVADQYPSLANAPWVKDEGETYVVPLIWGDQPIVYDPKVWDEVPPRYTDLADSRYKDALTTLDDPYSNLWLFSKSLGHSDPARIDQSQLDATLEAAKSVKPNIVTLAASFGDMADILARGDASMAFNGWAAMTVFAKDKGATLEFAQPATDGSFFWADGYSIPKDAPNEATAYAYTDLMASKRMNAKLAESLFSGATNSQSKELMDPSIVELYDYAGQIETDQEGVGPRSPGILPPLEDDGDIVGVAKWKKAWEEFKVA